MAGTYLVTGASGLIGKHLLPLLRARGAEVHVVARSRAVDAPGIVVHRGDITAPDLGLADVDSLPTFDHVVHLAGLYDLRAPKKRLDAVNVDGTRHLLAFLKARKFGGRLHHVSSVAVAGSHEGEFQEEDLDVGQKHKHPYHRSKYESEVLVRESEEIKYRIYRPSAVVGHSKTGEMDRIDGPYYLFKVLQKLRDTLPRWFPVVGFSDEPINMVPVDYVAAAIDHIMHVEDEGLDAKTFHVVDPAPPKFRETFNLLSDAAAGPRMTRTKLSRWLKKLPPATKMAGELASVKFLRDQLLGDFGIPTEIVAASNRKTSFDTTNLERALVGSKIRCPHQSEYLEAVWDYYARHLDEKRDPMKRRRPHVEGRKILITGASSGIGRSLAVLCAQLGGHVMLVARREDQLSDLAHEIRTSGGQADYFVADLSDLGECDRVVAEIAKDHGHVDILVNNAGRSIRRPASQSLDRFHDYERTMQLNYFAPLRLIRACLPLMKERRGGHIVNVLSAGARMPSPNFSAYGASKAALGHFTDSLGTELFGDGIHTTGVYFGWVRTPMMGKQFEENSRVLTPELAAEWIVDGIVDKKRSVMDLETKRRFLFNIVAPMTLSRLLNVFWRISTDDDGAHPDFAVDRMVAKRYIKGKLM